MIGYTYLFENLSVMVVLAPIIPSSNALSSVEFYQTVLGAFAIHIRIYRQF